MTHHVETEPDFMLPRDLGGVDVAGETLIVAVDGRPVVLVAQGGVVRNVELWETALANVRAVGSWNAQHLRTDILAKIRTVCDMVHPRETKDAVNDEVTADGIRLAHGRQIDLGIARAVATLAQTVAAGRT